MDAPPEPVTVSPPPEEGAVERLQRVWMRWPRACFLTLLAVATAIALVDRAAVGADTRPMLAGVALTALWIHLWVGHLRVVLAGARSRLTVPLALAGAAVVASLMLQSASFLVVAVPSVGSFFVALPVAWAALCALAVGSAVDVAVRRLGVEPHADGVLLAMAAVRILGIIAIGVIVKTVVTRAEERRRLFETLAAAERRAGVLEERSRLAREIHDTLAQGFAGIVVHLEAADVAVNRSAEELRANLRFALDVARDSLVEARRMMAELRPELLEEHALAAAVERACAEWSQRTGVPCRVEVTGEVTALDRDAEVTLLRATQEALNNVRKHARARSVAVTLSYMDSVVAVDVGDDGCGFAPTAVEGFGLRAMRERVARLGGLVVLESEAGHGTTLNVSLPAAALGAPEVPAGPRLERLA